MDPLSREIGTLLALPDSPVGYTADPGTALPGPFRVQQLAVAGVEAAARAAIELASARGVPVPSVELTDGAIAAAFTSERHLRVDGAAPALWGELSGFFEAADGWVRLHGNYRHHAAAAATALGCSPDRTAVAAEIRRRHAVDVEEAVVAAGGIAAAVRTSDAWQAHEQARALATRPLIDIARGSAPVAPASAGLLPASGLRVLDLTRVIAGPVAGRTLAAWGADVLRIDPPQLPEPEAQHLDTDWGKRSALLDLRAAGARASFRELVEGAAVVLTGYRPGSLAKYGADHAALLEINPRVIVVEISAWGSVGPWGGRRGFDSIVQAACGIADRCASAVGVPGALPAQALDHATGYLAAATAMALIAQGAGGSRGQLSLARTARTLCALGVAEPGAGVVDPAPWLSVRSSAYGELSYVRPPFTVDGSPLDYPAAPGVYGSAPARWC